MKISGNTVLITGGATGIGFALAQRFLMANNKVIIVGRREDKLTEAKDKHPELHIKGCDISIEAERTSLFNWIKNEFPQVNVLVNNAGIQQRVNLLQEAHEWDYYRKEISINVDAPIHLSMLFASHFIQQEHAAIINISSGLAIRPGVWVPIYSATKAALHSFTVSLRIQLAQTNVKVTEVFPPAVNTDLGGAGLHTFGAPLQDFADSVFSRLKEGDHEIGYGDSEARLTASKAENDKGAIEAWRNFLENNPDF
ncbi:SDR family NAD(P)-dependent oxidoreductase [Mesobacillus foraminis]|uniref:SDR family oxidoreductase n=1 Tax=Mesobacillus foraminis TaxID=279826 RepID=UPI00399F4D3A